MRLVRFCTEPPVTIGLVVLVTLSLALLTAAGLFIRAAGKRRLRSPGSASTAPSS